MLPQKTATVRIKNPRRGLNSTDRKIPIDRRDGATLDSARGCHIFKPRYIYTCLDNSAENDHSVRRFTFYYYTDIEKLIRSLGDNLEWGRLEIDLIRFTGPYFEAVNNRLMALKLVEMELSDLAGRHT